MANYFSDNRNLQYHVASLDLREIVDLLEAGYQPAGGAEGDVPGPADYDEAMDIYKESLEVLGDICADYIAPRSADIDACGAELRDGQVHYARGTEEARQKLAESGFMGVMLPRRFGGSNFPATVYMAMIEMVSRADASMMTLFGYQDVGELIARFGSEQQAAEFLPGLASGESIGCIVLSEPGAGSDLQAIKLKASQADDGGWVLNGVKHFISNGCGDVLMVLARSEPAVKDIFGLSLFVCPRSDRVRVAHVEEKMGLHGSPTCELIFDDAPAQLIGKRRFGMAKYILGSLDQARFSVAAQALGIAEGAYAMAVDYSQNRVQFGQKIGSFPAVQGLLEDMQLAQASSRAMLYEGSRWLDLKVQLEEALAHKRIDDDARKQAQLRLRQATQFVSLLSPLVKYAVTEAANEVCYKAQQVFGGLGYMRETGIERLVRDVRITTIYEGTSQIQVAASLKSILSDVLRDQFDEWQHAVYPERLGDIVTQIGAIRERFAEYLGILRSYDSDRARDAAARDLADMYSGIFAAYLMLRAAAEDPGQEYAARQYALRTFSFAVAGLTALQGGRYDKWREQ